MPRSSTRTISLLVPTSIAVAALLAACGDGGDDAPAPKLELLSSKPDMVSGGDALVAVTNLETAAALTVRVNGTDVTSAFKADPTNPQRMLGLVTGLKVGSNELVAHGGGASATLALTNYPITGPILSGPHETPYVCTTQEFTLPDGSTLGAPQDANCSAPTQVRYMYRTNTTPATFKPLPNDQQRPADLASTTTTDNKTVPYIVRVETGTINRAIYQTAMLHDPMTEPTPSPDAPPAGWNRKLIYPLGGGCQGGWYTQGNLQLTQGDFAGAVLLAIVDDQFLRKGYGVASSTLNIFANNCNDLLSSETTMMVKERFIESYGSPKFTIGTGSSGGAYQSNQTAQAYPGLFAGIVTGSSFPDPVTGFVGLADTRLLDIFFNQTRAGQYSEAKQRAISGYRQPGNIVFLSTSPTTSALRLDPRASFSLTSNFPPGLRYDPVTNPTGARATPYDHTVNVFGRRPGSLAAQRPLDNVGVQYGLKALNDGAITVDEFLDMNENIGGFDIDFNHIPQRTMADMGAVQRAYQSGRILQGTGGLPSTPIITQVGYDEGNAPNGGIHLKFWSFAIRDRLIKANGNAANQVILGPGTVRDDRFDQMDRWITAIQSDTSADTAAAKVAKNKPADLVDACWDREGNKITGPQSAFGPSACNSLYPTDMAPNLVAGAPVASDIIKCTLKPVTMSDYQVAFSAEQQARLTTIFPQGVCDWTKPGQGVTPLSTWASFGPSPINLLFDITVR